MAVRDALLAILLAGPAYGFQLHGELATRTGGRRVINVGQTYATLDRLTASGRIEPAGTTDDGLPLHRLTAAGRDEALAWLRGADSSGGDAWDETADRVLIAASLPGVEIEPILEEERAKWAERRALAQAGGVESALPAHVATLRRHAAALDSARADAVLAWLDEIAAAPATPFGLTATRPRRGRRPSVRDVDGATA